MTLLCRKWNGLQWKIGNRPFNSIFLTWGAKPTTRISTRTWKLSWSGSFKIFSRIWLLWHLIPVVTTSPASFVSASRKCRLYIFDQWSPSVFVAGAIAWLFAAPGLPSNTPWSPCTHILTRRRPVFSKLITWPMFSWKRYGFGSPRYGVICDLTN